MTLDIWSPYDSHEGDSAEDRERLRERLGQRQAAIRARLPRLRQEIENPHRDMNSVFEVLRPYHQNVQGLPMTPADLPELYALVRLVLERGGSQQDAIQRVLFDLICATAAAESGPFLLEMLHYSRRGDRFGPQRRQWALWGLARIALFHNVPEAYSALRERLDDRNAEVRRTAANLILDAYLNAHRPVSQEIIKKLRIMTHSDPDAEVRAVVKKYLCEPWAQEKSLREVD